MLYVELENTYPQKKLVYYVMLLLIPSLQKQPSRGVPRKWYSENMQQIYRRTPMPKCNFNKVVLQLY